MMDPLGVCPEVGTFLFVGAGAAGIQRLAEIVQRSHCANRMCVTWVVQTVVYWRL